MVQAQGFEGPSVGWNDSQPTFAIHQEGDFAVLRPPLEGDIENGFGIPQQPVHTILIARARKGMNRRRPASDNPVRKSDFKNRGLRSKRLWKGRAYG